MKKGGWLKISSHVGADAQAQAELAAAKDCERHALTTEIPLQPEGVPAHARPIPALCPALSQRSVCCFASRRRSIQLHAAFARGGLDAARLRAYERGDRGAQEASRDVLLPFVPLVERSLLRDRQPLQPLRGGLAAAWCSRGARAHGR